MQLRILQDQHAELQAACKAKDAELQELRELAGASMTLQSQDVQAAKIIELSKKNRQLTLALERERQVATKLRSEPQGQQGGAVASSGSLDPSSVEEIARSVVEQAAEAAEAANKEAAMWKERHQAQTNKMAQLEQKVFALEIESKKLTRALVREVGEDVPLAKVLEGGTSSDWKGRREVIQMLRDQVKALKAAQGLVPEGRQEAATKKVLSKISGTKTAEMERVVGELAVARAELDSLKAKYDAAVSRRKVLENEIASMKEKVAVVLDKSRNDDKLVAALRTELANIRRGAASAANKVTSRLMLAP
ncbi:uncharacterized protein HaLaN_22538 [Haematococcus lacustris]|uniref:Uncharacterized protein n=1 Tax=Haematococcus lacustris TaxID=44745 RepID=A0A6A0A0C2_HAELA|nr:uncharacterized protein HaLaN_22538 [Haematococcus lacustris]